MAHAVGCPLPVVCGLGGGLGGLGRSIATALLDALASWCTSVAGWLLGLVGRLLTHTTDPPVTTPWFLARQRALLAVAAPVALLALVAAALHAVVRGSLAELARTVLFRVPIALLLGAAGAGLVGLAVSVTDQLCDALAGGASLAASLHTVELAVAATSAAPGAVSIVVAGIVAFGALVLWIELMVRSAAITIATALLPLVLAASLWPPAVAWARRLAETIGALVVAKAMIVLVLVVALDAVAHADDGASSVLTGGAMLLLAAFMPFAVLRLVPAIEAAAVTHLEGARHRATGAARQATQRAVSLAVAGAGAGPAPLPSVDAVGSDPIGMLPGIDVDLLKGSALDPDASFVKGPPPLVAVPASAGEHVWQRDDLGPRLVWKPPWEPEP